MTTAMGYLSTPWTDVSARRIWSQGTLSGSACRHPLQKTAEGTEQEGAGATDRVDDPQAPKSEGIHRGPHRAIKDEVRHEARGLHKRVCLAVKFGEILVNVAKEAGVQPWIAEVVNQLPGVINPTPETDQMAGRIGREGILPHQRMQVVKQAEGGG